MKTIDYWENRYKQKGNSGSGSYGQLAEFKADVINNFIRKNDIKSIIEFGCGDGNQLSLFNVHEYIGLDVSESVIEKLRGKFADDMNKYFYQVSEFNHNIKSDLTLSLDVIYHLIEDNIYNEYMQKLFDYSDRYVIIYSCNKSDIVKDSHIRFRVFLSWVLNNRPDFKLIKLIENKYPYDKENPTNTSWSDFYIFERIN